MVDNTGTQRAEIRKALEAGDVLTHLDALYLFGCARLAARIHELRKDGMPIEKEMVERAGNRFAEYRMAK